MTSHIVHTSETGQQPEDPTTKWAPVVIDRDGRRQYIASGDLHAFTPYRGSARRYDTKAEALGTAASYRQMRMHRWIADIDAEPIPNARKDHR